MSRFRTVLTTVLAFSSQSVSAKPITLHEALQGVERSPTLAAADAGIDEATGNVEQAGAYSYNPALGGSAGAARTGGAVFYDFEIGISQAFELGGKRSARKRVAAAERDVASANARAARAGIEIDVRRAFLLAVVAQTRVNVTGENEDAARAIRAAAEERVRLGAATQTEVNVAVATLGRAIVAKKTAQRDVLVARQALGEALGLGADLEPTGTLPSFPLAPPSEDALVASAFTTRGDLAAAERMRSARGAAVDLADAQATPDPELSITYARDAVDASNAVIVGMRVELPLWNRNQGNRHASRAALRRSTIEATAMHGSVEREVRTAVRRYRAAVEAVAAFDEQVVGTLGENLKLARETLAAGKLGLLEVNAVRRDLVDSQLTYLDALVEAIEARAGLERAIGRSLEVTP